MVRSGSTAARACRPSRGDGDDDREGLAVAHRAEVEAHRLRVDVAPKADPVPSFVLADQGAFHDPRSRACRAAARWAVLASVMAMNSRAALSASGCRSMSRWGIGHGAKWIAVLPRSEWLISSSGS